jgi:hypothetical protein
MLGCLMQALSAKSALTCAKQTWAWGRFENDLVIGVVVVMVDDGGDPIHRTTSQQPGRANLPGVAEERDPSDANKFPLTSKFCWILTTEQRRFSR